MDFSGPADPETIAARNPALAHGFAFVTFNNNDCGEDTTLRNPDWAEFARLCGATGIPGDSITPCGIITFSSPPGIAALICSPLHPIAQFIDPGGC